MTAVWKLLLALLLWAGFVAAPWRQATAATSETVLVNGRILLLDPHSSVAEALLVRDTLILATGSTNEMLARAQPTAAKIDLGGRTVIPGLIDSHLHAIRAGLRFSTEVSWIGATSIPDAMDRIRRAALYGKQGDWVVVGGGWTPNQFVEGRLPTADELATAAPGHRIFVQLFYRAAFLSPTGLQALGLADDADLPAGAKFERATDGQPTGWINGSSAVITELYARLPQPTTDASMIGTRQFMRELNRLGVTGLIDPGGYNLAPEDYETLFRLDQAGGLTVRVAYSLCGPRPGTELADLQRLTRSQTLSQSMRPASHMLRFNGIGERVTWGLYNNDTPSAEQLQEFAGVARWAAEEGMPLTVHWNNDKSVHHLLDIFERIDREKPIRTLRWSIAHLHDASDGSLQRMKVLGVGWLMQNGLHFAATSYITERGAAISRAPPLKTAMKLGLAIGAGTDGHRVMSYNPFVALRWMVDGRTVDGVPTRGPAELVAREEALRLFTQGSAWFAFDEENRGTLEAGRMADLAVLDGDYLSVPTEKIGQLQSVLTMVGGRIVFAAAPFAGADGR
jgi:predicted amidohydrolase YtcJ